MSNDCGFCWNEVIKESLTTGISRIIFEGPQGSGKTSLAQLVSSSIGCGVLRGYPTGAEIAAAQGEQKKLCKLSYQRIASPQNWNGEQFMVFDRSPLSHYAYSLRAGASTEAEIWERYSAKQTMCAMAGMIALSELGAIHLFMLERNPQDCLDAQDPKTEFSIKDIGVAKQEALAYRLITKVVSTITHPNFHVNLIQNDGSQGLQVIANSVKGIICT
jgi:DNA polymerase III delta prime subunit